MMSEPALQDQPLGVSPRFPLQPTLLRLSLVGVTLNPVCRGVDRVRHAVDRAIGN